MAIKDWPVPVRGAVAILLLLASVTIVAGSSILLLSPFPTAGTPSGIWIIALFQYSTLITAPVAIICAAAAAHYMHRKSDRFFPLYFVVGAVVGVGVGLVMVPLTGGLSLVCAPPFAAIVLIAGWFLRPSKPDDSTKTKVSKSKSPS